MTEPEPDGHGPTTRCTCLLGASIGGVGVVLHHAFGVSLFAGALTAYTMTMIAIAIDLVTAEQMRNHG
jgi:hypothetical protein